MAEKTDLTTSPYFDDYEENKNFHRVLYKPGFAVQARELNQQQTILQNQISRIGRHLFNEGAMLIPGNISYDSDLHFCRLDTANLFNVGILSNSELETFWLNKIITNQDGVKAQVVSIGSRDGNGFVTLYLKYVSNSTDGLTGVFSAEDTIEDTEESSTTAIIIPTGSADDSIGVATSATIEEGIYFVKGFAVKVHAQRIILSTENKNPTLSVGLQVVESVVTAEEDSSLYDNATGTPNESAPGADRLKYSLILSSVDISQSQSENFVELLRVIDGEIVKKVDKTSFNIIGDELASRTFDESGNYTVDPFIASVEEHPTDLNKLQLVLDSGKAFVRGYEIKTLGKTKIDIDKATEFLQKSSISIQTELGNYMTGNNLHGVPFINSYATCELYDSLTTTPHSLSGNKIGTARIRGIEHLDGDANTASATYKIFLFDIQLDAGKTFDNVKQIYQANPGVGAPDFTCDVGIEESLLNGSISEIIDNGAGSYTFMGSGTGWKNVDGQRLQENDILKIVAGLNITFVRVEAVTTDSEMDVIYVSGDSLVAATELSDLVYVIYSNLYDTSKNSLLFPLPDRKIKTIRDDSGKIDTTYTVNRFFEVVDLSSTLLLPGNLELSLSLSGEEFDSNSESDWIVYNYTQNTLVNGFNVVGAGTNSVVISGGTPLIGDVDGEDYLIIGPVRKFSPTGVEIAPKEKTKTLVLNQTKSILASQDKKNISLDKADVYRLVSVVEGSDDITDRYELDNGQRDNFYDIASINLIPGKSEPAGSITITFDYFNHGSNGNYFSVDSYLSAGLNYAQIPKYFSKQTGQSYDLADFLDFRPRISDSGENFTGTGSSFTDIPIDRVFADYQFFLPRIDQLYLTPRGEFALTKGASSINPSAPDAPSDGMILYNIGLVANTQTSGDVFLEYIENKRYTMRDIGRLEERIDTLEYYTELSLLEKETADLQIIGADGLDRFKNGFIVDNFNDHGIGDVLSRDYKVSIDFVNGHARPLHLTQNVSLKYNNSESTNVNETNDLLILPYEHYQFLEQNIATSAINVNPYNVFNFLGTAKLTPSSDQWKDIKTLPALKTEIDQYATMVSNFERQGVLGTVWNEWNTNWSGEVSWDKNKRELLSSRITRTRSLGQRDRGRGSRIAPGNGIQLRENTIQRTGIETGEGTRTGTRVTAIPKTITKDLGERIVDVSYITYMRSINILAEGKSLKPSTKLYPFFDETRIDDYACFVGEFDGVNCPNFYTKALRSSQAGSTYEYLTIDLTSTPSFAAASEDLLNKILTDENGNSIHIIGVTSPGGTPQVLAVYDTKNVSSPIVVGSKFSAVFNSGVVTTYNVDVITSESKTVPDLITDITGSINIAVRIPNPNDTLTKSLNSDLKFLTGTRQFEVSDDPQRNVAFTTTASSSFFAQGLLETRQSQILSIKTAELNRESVVDERDFSRTVTDVRVKKKWVDPVAQSFLITEPGGIYLSKIHLYFRTKDNNIPVTVEVRETEVGLPGSYVVPFSEVTVDSADVHTNVVVDNSILEVDGVQVTEGVVGYQQDAEGNFLRNSNNELIPILDDITQENINDNFVPTVFEFSTPIYLKEGVEYAFVVMANSDKYEIWRANASNPNPELKVGTNIPVTENPYAGSMFKSQNASTWTPEQSSDLMFRFYRSNFTSLSGTAVFENLDYGLDRLENNPIETATGESIIRISHENHGMSNGDYVGIVGCQSDVNGIAFSDINGIHQISNVTLNSYAIQLDPSITATSSGFSGGAFVEASKNIPYERIQIMANSVIPSGTDVIWSLTTKTKKHPYNFNTDRIQQSEYGTDGPFNIVVNEDVIFNTPRQVASSVNELERMAGEKSLVLEAALLTSKSTLSPIIGSERLSALTVHTLLDSTNLQGNGSTNIPELDEVDRLVSGSVTYSNLNGNEIDLSYDADEEIGANLNNIVVGNYIEIDGTNSGTFLVLNKEYSPGGTPEILFTLRAIDGQSLSEISESVTITQYKNFIDEISPEFAQNSARYICRKMVLSQPAIGLRISMAASVQPGSEIEVYYRTQSDQSKRFEDLPYTKAVIDAQPTFSQNREDFRDYVFTVDNLSSFTAFSVKVVLKGGNPSTPPILKDFRAIALGT